MRKNNKILAICLAVVIFLISVFAVHIFAANILDGYSYELDGHGRAIIVGWDNSSDTLYIPGTIGNFYVAGIGNSSFRNDDFIHTLDLSGAAYCDAIGMYAFAGSVLEGALTIPTRVTNIGTSAFEDCDGLTELSFSSYGEKVPAQCFQYCDNLQTVVLTDYITTIERYAFYHCPNLTSVTIPRSVTSINNTAFSGDDDLVIYCYYDSYAQQYAEEKGIEYVLFDPPAPTQPPTEPVTEIPTELVTDAPTESVTVTFILGDADGDTFVTILDATKIQRVLASLEADKDGMVHLRGNVCGGGLSVIDATNIQRYLATIPVSVAIGEEVTVEIPSVSENDA